MIIRWRQLLVRITIWLAAEIILNFLGLDNLADYSEFIYEQEVALLSQYTVPAIERLPLS
ncbi:hypothetical protein BJP34_15285 [Moorena producens PAL-8-15-08-1]|uniref:Uncharacterized protein n=1 Tax=Moorena producens PAL-8-15-08-1 TaxID=1458985 RepID=A0A1D8TT41_9CYAN|nr:hypothetical protein BJP34_15285 [Moorena producens PAL-8-15-08-1]